MAGTGHKLWAAGDVVAASGSTSLNTYIQDQVVGVYADSTARDAAFGGAGEPTLAEGMVCWLSDTNVLQTYDGSAWVTVAASGAWSTWTPTITGFTAGNATIVARYGQVGKTVHFTFKMTMGTTTSYGSSFTFTAPVGRHADAVGTAQFVTRMTQSGAGYVGISNFFTSDDRVYCYALQADNGQVTSMDSTAPFTWTTGGVLQVTGTYEAA